MTSFGQINFSFLSLVFYCMPPRTGQRCSSGKYASEYQSAMEGMLFNRVGLSYFI